ncbi:YcnI family copper-binding membrane protein [Streptomyces aureoverticillatus]|uniref:YcnI family copper-binding membrane protein n=1 Tax=Streptomyces aureoverticillatus TaxID=66871 RepID=UPI0013D9C62E|nr:YcnI family protein [Streptomyces aureoverticillatus]QIB44811.1 YcnI family protein [Streptomyces aureoverticillatus]
MKSLTRVSVVAGTAASAVLLLSAVPAFAHVSVSPEGEAAKGGYATVNFKVPNERDDASTTKLEVTFPADQPLASVMTQPVPGWKAKVTKTKLKKPIEIHGEKIDEAVSKVVWTADGKGIEPGTFQKFPLSLGQLPEDADQMVFKALQTYSNKDVVRWIEPQQKGAEEPEFPAPALALSAPSEDHHGGAGSDDKSDDKDKAAAKSDAKSGGKEESASDSDSSDTTARTLGIVGIVVGAAGVAFGVLAGRRRVNS